MLSRKQARKLILQILYRNEFHRFSNLKNPDSLSTTAISFLVPFAKSKTSPPFPSDNKFISDILKGVEKHKKTIDDIISKYSINWQHKRISLVDLNIMRMAVFEILFYPEVPDKVALNEALELTKIFCSQKSVSFINGILDQVVKNKKQ